MTTEKPQIVRQIEEAMGRGFELHAAPEYAQAASPWARLMAVKKKQAKYLLDDQGQLVGLNMANCGLNDDAWKKVVKLLSDGGVRLKALNLCSNQLKQFESLPGIADMVELDLEDNPLSNPPAETMQRGRAAVLRFLQEVAKHGKRDGWEVKMLIVGEAEVGKTTLWNLLQDESHPVPHQHEDDARTLGIQIKEGWRLPHLDRKDVGISVNLWDFGGQAIQYMTHQFFLTRRSLYVLMADDEKEQQNFSYWLDMINLAGCRMNKEGEQMPMLVVLNRKALDGNVPVPYDEEVAARQYPALKITKKEVDLKERSELPSLRKTIQGILSKDMPHLPMPIPTPWDAVRQELKREAQSANYISYDKFIEICKTQGIDDQKNQDDVSQLLHDLGDILHFRYSDLEARHESNLQNFVVLNLRWAVDAFYAVLKDVVQGKGGGAGTTLGNAGRFSSEQLHDIWDAKGLKRSEQMYLREMMLLGELGICFRTFEDGKETFIVPQLLPELPQDEQTNFFDSEECRDALRYACYYEFMPMGIASRLTVSLHEDLAVRQDGRKMIWKNAALLEERGEVRQSRALVWLVSGKKSSGCIRIEVHGSDPEERRHLLRKIRGKLQKVHAIPFGQLACVEKIPCSCKNCLNSQDPFEFELKMLEDMRENGREEIQCRHPDYQMVSVRQLLEGGFLKDDLGREKGLGRPFQKACSERDVFICHSSEDKAKVAQPIVAALERAGISCWYDETEIGWGDRIVNEIDWGLANSRYVIVVLSRSFAERKWTQQELHSSLRREIGSGVTRVLPLFVGDERAREGILEKFSLLADKRYLAWEGASSADAIVSQLRVMLRKSSPDCERKNTDWTTAEPSLSSKKEEPLTEPLPRKKKSSKRTVLVLAANPDDSERLRLNNEIKKIEEGLKRSKQRSKFVLKLALAAGFEDLRRAMLDHKPSIVHFCGHGFEHDGLAFEGRDGRMELASSDALADLFEVFSSKAKVECVLLNACYSEDQAEAIHRHVPCVIGMCGSVEDAMATEFAVAFYDALGAGESFEFAFKLACASMKFCSDEDCRKPVLKLRT